MALSRYIEDSLSRRVIFFTGKGGVGKSSLAWATALACRRQGKKVLVVSWSAFDTEARPFFTDLEGVESITLDALTCFREYALLLLKFEKLYDAVFDNFVLNAFVQAAPGVSETVIAGKIWHLSETGGYDLIVIDLPSSGHALSFFQSPLGVKKVFSVGFVSKETEKILALFRSPSTRVDFVTLPEELPMVECLELKNKLADLHALHFGWVHVNQVTPTFPLPTEGSVTAAARECVAQHAARVARDGAGLAMVENFKINVRKIPRIVSPKAKAIVHLISERMVTE